MAVFDVSFANKGTRKSGSDYGILVDQLEILESSLSSDGKLSPGDYGLLTRKAQEVYGHPGLSPANRSNIEVKMARYASDAKKVAIKDQSNIQDLNNEVTDASRTNGMLLGGNPQVFLQAQADMYREQITQLRDSIDQADASGESSASHRNEYNSALTAFGDTMDALDYMKSRTPGSAPISGQAAYITTNQRGEITDVQVMREGSKTGYLETNGLYGGLKIYGKLNRKDNGENVFLLGSKTFKAADVMIPGPDGTFKGNTLLDSSGTQKIGPGLTKSQGLQYSEMDPASLRTQTAVRPGSYVLGDKGFIYKKEGDGSYTKYVNTDPAKLGISENDILKVPRSYEQNAVIPIVKSTVDASTQQPALPSPTTSAPFGGATVDFSKPVNTPVAPAPVAPGALGRPATGAPTERAPQGAQGIAGRALGAAKGFFGRVFGGQ